MASAQQPLIDSIYGKLLSLGLAADVYDSYSGQDFNQPTVVFNVVSDPVQPYFTGDSVRMDFQIDVYGPLNNGTKNTRIIADSIFSGLHRSSITASGYTGVSILCTERGNGMQEEFIQGGRTLLDAWRVTQQYRLFGTAS